MTPKLDTKAAIQNVSNLYEIIFNHPKESADKEIRSFVKEFETTRNNREIENLTKCVKFIQDSPDRLIDGKEQMEKHLNQVNENLKKSKSEFELLLNELNKLKQQDKPDLYSTEREKFLKELDEKRKDVEIEMNDKEQELNTEYRIKIEEGLRGAPETTQ